jgi:signal transduction histidine kinase
MTSFLGVPIVAKGRVLGAFYLTNKEESDEFTDADRRLTELFAAHAAIAIENALLFERSRELTVVEERNRLARDLHDSVAQTLFSLSLTAEAALSRSQNGGATDELLRVRDLARDALNEVRSIVFELRPADLAADGLVPTLAKHADVLGRVFGQRIEVDVRSDNRLDPSDELELFRIVQEAMSNALKHARASRIDVEIDLAATPPRVAIRDDGIGFDPADVGARSRHLGLTSMEERARTIRGRLAIDSHAGAGTTVTVELA